jgi:hypothetical protein
MTGVMGIDEQTCSFEELRTRQLLLRTGSEAPGLRRFEDAGFCPVIGRPSVIAKLGQSGAFS